ncbi:hypothetical protein GEMRC1_013512 [Eukaryota sp. GEM-RC1]
MHQAIVLSNPSTLFKALPFLKENSVCYISSGFPNLHHLIAYLSAAFDFGVKLVVPSLSSSTDLVALSDISLLILDYSTSNPDPFNKLFSTLAQISNIPCLNLSEVSLPPPRPPFQCLPPLSNTPPATYLNPSSISLPSFFVLYVLDDLLLDLSTIRCVYEQCINLNLPLFIHSTSSSADAFLTETLSQQPFPILHYPYLSNTQLLNPRNIIVLSQHLPRPISMSMASMIICEKYEHYNSVPLNVCVVNDVSLTYIHEKVLVFLKNCVTNYPLEHSTFDFISVKANVYNIERDQSHLTVEEINQTLAVFDTEELQHVFLDDSSVEFLNFVSTFGGTLIRNRCPFELWNQLFNYHQLKINDNIAELLSLEYDSNSFSALISPLLTKPIPKYSVLKLIGHVFSTVNPGFGQVDTAMITFLQSAPTNLLNHLASLLALDLDVDSAILLEDNPAWIDVDPDHVFDCPDYTPSTSGTDICLELDDTPTSSLSALSLSSIYPDLVALSCWNCPLDCIDDVMEGLIGLNNLRSLWLNETPVSKGSNWPQVCHALVKNLPKLEILNSKFTFRWSSYALIFVATDEHCINDDLSRKVYDIDLSGRSIKILNISAFKHPIFSDAVYLNLSKNPLHERSIDDILQLSKILTNLTSVDLPVHFVDSSDKCRALFTVFKKSNISRINGCSLSQLQAFDSKVQGNLAYWPVARILTNEIWSNLIGRVLPNNVIEWSLLNQVGKSLFNNRHDTNAHIFSMKLSPIQDSMSIFFPINDMPPGFVISAEQPGCKANLSNLQQINRICPFIYDQSNLIDCIAVELIEICDLAHRSVFTTSSVLLQSILEKYENIEFSENDENALVIWHSDFDRKSVLNKLKMEGFVSSSTIVNVAESLARSQLKSCFFDLDNLCDLHLFAKTPKNLYLLNGLDKSSLPIATTDLDRINVISNHSRVFASVYDLNRQMISKRQSKRLIFCASGGFNSFKLIPITCLNLKSKSPFSFNDIHDVGDIFCPEVVSEDIDIGPFLSPKLLSFLKYFFYEDISTSESFVCCFSVELSLNFFYKTTDSVNIDPDEWLVTNVLASEDTFSSVCQLPKSRVEQLCYKIVQSLSFFTRQF